MSIRWLVALLSLVLFVLPARAEPPITLAVLPMDALPDGEPHAGLGKALAGMMVTDLSVLDGVQLVERARLDALFAEIELGDSAFIQPQTAQKFGQGVGAEYVIVGDYAVVAGTLALNARIVRVDTGTILDASSASGPVSDFVSVEKDLMELLVQGLELELTTGQRRALLTAAPTESFDAFSAFGQGLDARDEGDLEAAREAFKSAVALDPEFEQARQALTEVRAQLDAFRSERSRRYDTVYAEMNDAVLAKWPDERTREPSVKDDLELVTGFGMRLMALENEGLDCQRYDEMWHYLERNDWVLTEPEGLGESLEAAIAEVGFKEYADETGGPELAHDYLEDRSEYLWDEGLDYFLTGEEDLGWWDFMDPHSGLVWSLTQCHPAEVQLTELARIKKSLVKRGLHTQRVDDDLPLGIWLDLTWAFVHGREVGSAPALTRHVERLLAEVKVDDVASASEEAIELEADVMRHLEHAVEMASTRDVYNRSNMGQDEDAILALADAILARDTTMFALDTPGCSALVKTMDTHASLLRDMVVSAHTDTDYRHVNNSLEFFPPLYGPLRDLGCLQGTPATVANFDEARALGLAALESPTTCDVSELRRAVETTVDPAWGQDYALGAAARVLSAVHTARVEGCW
jgi:TolB-like protein